MTIFYNFLLKIKASRARSMVMPILETRNVNNGYIYVWFILSWIKNLNNIKFI